MKIKNILVLCNTRGCDKISIHIEASTPFPMMNYEPVLSTDAAPGHGIIWVLANFPGVKTESLDFKTGNITVIFNAPEE